MDPAPALDALRQDLARARDVPSASEAVMAALTRLGHDLPSLYLERGGRLRCMAQRGYWQVYDGLLPGAGVLGSTVLEGRTRVLQTVEGSSNYIVAVPSVAAEMCVPVRYAGRVVGAVNVEAMQPFTDEDVRLVEDVTCLFEEALRRLGGPPAESRAERIARECYELASAERLDEMVGRSLQALVDVSGLSSAALWLGAGDSREASGAIGPLGAALAGLDPSVVAQLADYVELATSSYGSGVGGEAGFDATREVRAVGVRALVVLALASKGHRGGILVVADDRAHPDIATLVPVLELLAATTAATIEAATVSNALQASQRALAHQVRHDALTGLANRSMLFAALDAAIAVRQDTGSTSCVLFVDLDGFKAVNDKHGHGAGDRLLQAVAGRLRLAARDTDLVARFGGDEFVLLCRGLDRRDDGVALAARVVDRIARPFVVDGAPVAMNASVGIAFVADFADSDGVIAAADDAMYVAKRRGPGTTQVAAASAGGEGQRAIP